MRGGGDDGFTLIGLMLVVALINIGLGVAVTSWLHIDKRADEAELIWRGEQYVRAVQCHRQQAGGYPEDLEDLLDSGCLRSLYPDPMTISGEWRVLRESDVREDFGAAGGPAGQDPGASPGGSSGFGATRSNSGGFQLQGSRVGGANPGGGMGAQGGNSSATRGGGGLQTPGGAGGAQDASLQDAYLRMRGLSDRMSQNLRGGAGNGIVGVVSTSTAEALRAYKAEMTYDMWEFVAR